MSDKKIKKGFTIVELLIVIVVIGILSTIVIVTYQGVQNKANTTVNQTNAKEVLGKAEAFHALNTYYPDDVTALKAATDSSIKISPSIVANVKSTAPAAGAEAKTIQYTACATQPAGAKEGITVSYYDYDTKTVKSLTAGTCS